MSTTDALLDSTSKPIVPAKRGRGRPKGQSAAVTLPAAAANVALVRIKILRSDGTSEKVTLDAKKYSRIVSALDSYERARLTSYQKLKDRAAAASGSLSD